MRYLFIILSIYLLLAFYKIDDVPGAWFGDISNEHEYVLSILKGRWPMDFLQSTGPLYHYIVAPFALVGGANYLTYKVVSIFIGLIGLVGMYLFIYEIGGKKIALLSTFSAAISFWYLVWTRLGSSPQMLSPLLVSLVLFFCVRYIKIQKNWVIMVAGIIATLGLITYPALYVLPLIPIGTVLFSSKQKIRRLFWLFVSFLPITLLFIYIVMSQPELFIHGYIGSKLGTGESARALLWRFPQYVLATFGQWHIRGDATFRTNAQGLPHLDIISGMFMLVGIMWWARFPKKFIPLIAGLMLLLLPQMYPGNPIGEIPNSGRSLGAVPLVFLFVGTGLSVIRNNYLIVASIAVMALFSLSTYFGPYQKGLPNQNAAWEKVISGFIDTLPVETHVKLTGCCWGEFGEPEPKAIFYTLKNQHNRTNIYEEAFITEPSYVAYGVVYIFNPQDMDLIISFKQNYPEGDWQHHADRFGVPVFISLRLPEGGKQGER